MITQHAAFKEEEDDDNMTLMTGWAPTFNFRSYSYITWNTNNLNEEKELQICVSESASRTITAVYFRVIQTTKDKVLDIFTGTGSRTIDPVVGVFRELPEPF